MLCHIGYKFHDSIWYKSIQFFNKNIKVYTYEELVQDSVWPYLDEINEKQYLERNMQWYILPGHYWLELRLNAKNFNNSDSHEKGIDDTDRPGML